MRPAGIAAGALALALLGGSCAGGETAGPDATPAPARSEAAEPELPVAAASDTVRPDRSPLADLVRPAGDLVPDGSGSTPPQPVSLAVEGIGVTDAPVRDVGVDADGEMEIPDAAEVGWYRWSPSPGGPGSAVLAAHVAFDGTDGVFRHLDDVAVGASVTVGYDDGSSREFVIVEAARYDKARLPFDRIFSRSGEPVVALITCGGDFDSDLRSYADNVVAYAVPARVGSGNGPNGSGATPGGALPLGVVGVGV